MLTKTIFAAGALLSAVAAIPMQAQNKRDIVWETKIEEAYVTVDVTTTIWLNPGETPPTVSAANAPAHYGHKHHGNNHHPHNSPPAESTPAAPSSPAETSAPPYVAPTTTAAPAPPTSTYVAPSPTSTTAAPVASSPPAYSSPAASPSSPPSSGGSHGTTYTGDITYYTPGLGSCGITSTSSEAVVALPFAMMDAVNPPNPNDNPYCGKTITIQNGGKTATATVVDTCPGCVGGSIDLSPSVFTQLAQMSEGRVSGVNWWFN